LKKKVFSNRRQG